jgi:ribosomal protein S27AE
MAVCDQPGGRRPDAQSESTLFDDLGGEPTLDEVVSGVWEGLTAHQHAACPRCGGGMVAVYGAHARPSAGRCGDCGTTLS